METDTMLMSCNILHRHVAYKVTFKAKPKCVEQNLVCLRNTICSKSLDDNSKTTVHESMQLDTEAKDFGSLAFYYTTTYFAASEHKLKKTAIMHGLIYKNMTLLSACS